MNRKFLLLIILLVLISSFISKLPVIAETYISGVLPGTTTWTLNSSPYIITGNTLVGSGITLTIEPGVTVKFNNDTMLQVNGQLVAVGTSKSRVTFTCNSTVPKTFFMSTEKYLHDNWYILFEDISNDAVIDAQNSYLSGCILKYCIFERGRGIKINNSYPYIESNIFRYNIGGQTGTSVGVVLNIVHGGTENPIKTLVVKNNSIDHIVFGDGIGITGGSNSIIKLAENTILGSWYGIYIPSGSEEIHIEDNLIKDAGVQINASNVFFEKNVINHGRSTFSGNITIKENIFTNYSDFNYYWGVGTYTGHVYRVIAADNYSGEFSSNTLINNTGIADSNYNWLIGLTGANSSMKFNYNNCINNSNYHYYVYQDAPLSVPPINFKDNYWGTTNTSLIDSKFYDFYDDFNIPVVSYTPIATTAFENTRPFCYNLVLENEIDGYVTNKTLKYSWEAVDDVGIVSYEVYVSSDSGEYNYVFDTAVSSCLITAEYGHTYSIKVKALDSIGTGYAMVTDGVICSQADPIPPDPINNLFAEIGGFPGQVVLRWNATGDNGSTRTITSGQYAVQYTTQPLVYDVIWSTTNAQAKMAIFNVSRNQAMSLPVHNLIIGTTYTFAIWLADSIPNWSDISNMCSIYLPQVSDPTHFSAVSGRSWVGNGQTTTVTATITDSYSLPCKNVEVDYSILAGTGTINLTTLLSDSNGQAQINYTAPAHGIGRTTVRASVSGFNPQDVNIDICAAIDANGGTIIPDNDPNTRIILPQNAVSNTVKITIVLYIELDVSELAAINTASNNSLAKIIKSAIKNIGAKKDDDTDYGDFNNLVTVEIPYEDADNDGYVDGTSNITVMGVRALADDAGIKVDDLKAYRLVQGTLGSIFQQVDDGGINTVDKENKVVKVQVRQFGTLTIGAAQVASNLKQVKVYPNPCKENQTKQITFINLTDNTTVKIFTLSGDLVKTIEGAIGQAVWDLKNQSNNLVASGIYTYVATNPKGEKKTGRIALIK